MKQLKYLLFLFFFVPALAQGQFLFKDVTASAGIFMSATGATEAGPGVVIFDLNGDGWDDIYMSGGIDSDKLFLNMKDGTFQNVATPNFTTHTHFNAAKGWQDFPRGGIAFDYDNDGYPDIYSVCYNNDFLWHNNGDGTFTDVTRKAGISYSFDLNQSMSASFGDFRGIGLNDFYVARWIEESKFLNNGAQYAHKGFPNWLYINNGDGTFTESAKAYGVDGDTGTTNIAIFFDYDRDGDLDLLIGNDFGVELTPNEVWKNMLMETGEAKFVRVDSAIGLQTHIFCMGIGPNDYNRDGNFDFFETSFGHDSLMKNNGNGTFTNVSNKVLPPDNGYERSGSGFMTTTWTALFGDFDNDGWEDGFIVHGFEGAISPWITNPDELDTSQFLHNYGGIFEDKTDDALGGDYLASRGRGAAYLDFNHDGKLDICYGSMAKDPVVQTSDFHLLQNITPNPGHWMEMRFTARRTAKEGIGTIVDVWAGGIVRSRQVSTGGGFGSQNSLMQHVGLGEYSVADSIVVYWPCDKNRHRQIDRFYNISADHLYYIMENMGAKPDTNLISLNPITPPALAVQNVSAQSMTVYPNPASSTLHIQNIEALGIKHFEIYDLLGIKHLEMTGTENNFSLSVGGLQPGCYVLRITTDGNTITKRFIKE
jgi:hypothetical protein